MMILAFDLAYGQRARVAAHRQTMALRNGHEPSEEGPSHTSFSAELKGVGFDSAGCTSRQPPITSRSVDGQEQADGSA